MIVGIDEAGKGCVVGDLVIGAVFWSSEKPPVKGLKDSKVLTPKKREELFDELKSHPCVTVSIHAHEIRPGNILKLQIFATRLILERFKPQRAVIDCPHPKPDHFVRLLGFPDVDIIAEHKADRNHPIVSAGSIVAKVTRDRRLNRISSDLDCDLGCGYPGDEKLRSWLESLVHKPDPRADRVIRWGWHTCESIFGDEHVERKLAGH